MYDNTLDVRKVGGLSGSWEENLGTCTPPLEDYSSRSSTGGYDNKFTISSIINPYNMNTFKMVLITIINLGRNITTAKQNADNSPQ